MGGHRGKAKYGKVHVIGLGFLVCGIASGLTPSVYNLQHSYYSSEQLSVILYALSTSLTSISALLKERALKNLDTPPEPNDIVKVGRRARFLWLLALSPAATYIVN